MTLGSVEVDGEVYEIAVMLDENNAITTDHAEACMVVLRKPGEVILDVAKAPVLVIEKGSLKKMPTA